jgi:uncharacterized membrane protein YgdD (TMEM256/DUF423 family)
MNTARLFLALGFVFAAIGVAAGAFGAHALSGRVTPERAITFETGVRYQMYHAFGLMIVGFLAANWPSWQAAAGGWAFIAGILIFSGSLYVLVLTDTPWLGAITPIGGVAFIAGWGLLAWAAISSIGR